MSIIIPSNSIVSGGFSVDNSCRFDDGSSDTMSRDNGTPTNLKKFSISLWFKRTEPGLNKYLITGFDTEDNRALLQFSSDQLLFQNQTGGSNNTIIKSNAVFRDPSAWYHFCIIVDTTQGTDTNRVKMYVNGSQVTSLASSTYPSVNTDLELTDSANSILLNQKGDGSDFNSGYYSEVVVLDGTAASITDFGEFDEDSGIWKPIDVSGLTFGNNGFYLDFENSGALGADVSGNSNNFTVNNLTAIDQSTDTCTNNFATLNPLDVNGIVLSEGNLNAGSAGATWRSTRGTFGMSSGKWYWEMKIIGGNTPIDAQIGVGSFELAIASNGEWSSANPSVAYSSGDGSKKVNGTSSSYGASFTTNDIIGVAFDVDNLNVTFYKNGASQGAITTGFSASDTFACEVAFYGRGGGTTNGSFNFGSPPYAISSGNTDGDGYGNFEYAVPSGYFSLNTKNLAEYG